MTIDREVQTGCNRVRKWVPRALRLAAAALVTAGALGWSGLPSSAAERPVVSEEERAAALVRPALVYIETEWSGYVIDEAGNVFNDGDPYEYRTSCTGFVVNPAGHIMTAGHCVDDTAADGGAKATFIEFAAEELISQIEEEVDPSAVLNHGLANWTVEGESKGSPVGRQVFIQRGRAVSGQRTGEALPARVVDFRSLEAGDVALLKVEANDLPSSKVFPGDELEVGMPMLSVGYPGLTENLVDESLEPTNKDGKISAKKTSGTFPVYEVSAAIARGMSGGPSVNLEGEVIGVNSFGPGDSEAFNYIVPASNVREILARNGVTNSLGQSDTIYRAALDSYYQGEYSDAIEHLDRLLDLDPAHQQAQEIRRLAAKERAASGDSGGDSGFPVVPAALAATAVVGLAGGATTVVKRSKREPATAQAPTAGDLTAEGATRPAAQPSSTASLTEDGPRPSGAFCGSCGSRRNAGSAFCADCGSKY